MNTNTLKIIFNRLKYRNTMKILKKEKGYEGNIEYYSFCVKNNFGKLAKHIGKQSMLVEEYCQANFLVTRYSIYMLKYLKKNIFKEYTLGLNPIYLDYCLFMCEKE